MDSTEVELRESNDGELAASSASRAPSSRASESIAESMMLLLAATVIQRLVGLVRSVLFCRWLSEEELGQWDLVFGFLGFAAPFVVFGIPGSFARYVGYFRQHGQEHRFRVWAVVVCALLTSTAGLLMWYQEEFFSWFIFQRPGRTQGVRLTAITLLTVIAFNFLIEWYGGMRMFRVVAVLYFVNSVLFATLGITLLLTWHTNAVAVTLSYGLACLISVVSVILWVRVPGDAAAAVRVRLPIGSKILPFAIWMWITNLVSNLLDLVDRYMLVHWSGLDANSALAAVGQYHSSRVIPLLLVSVAAIVERSITPHLSLEWETGHRRRVGATLNRIVKLSGLGLWLAGMAIMLGAPLLFNVAFGGKYNEGLHVLPWTITYCIWFGMATICMNYLWCTEKSRLASFAFAGGLLTNVGLNVILIPMLGLHGAVLGTAAGNLLTLLAAAQFARWLGWHMDPSIYLVYLLPLMFPLGPVPSLVIGVFTIVVVIRTELFFRDDEKKRIVAWAFDRWHRLRDMAKRRPAVNG